jgi:hypothetical protein
VILIEAKESLQFCRAAGKFYRSFAPDAKKNSLRMPIPDFFLVGAPKCGTTALYTYLSRHPDVGMSNAKEPNFFATDTVRHRAFSTLPRYLTNFDGIEGKARIGEASVLYLSSPAAPQAIHNFNSSAQIIIMLRDPIEVMHALHAQRLHGGSEHIIDFEIAVESNERRYWLQGPFKGEPVGGLTYRELTRFSTQVRRYFESFGRERVHVILFDDFVRDPKRAYEDVLKFLDLRSDGCTSYEPVNANKRVRSISLHRAMRHPALLRLKDSLPRLGKGARALLDRVNLVEEARPPIDPEFRLRLQREFDEEKRHLAGLIGRGSDELDRCLHNW